MVLRSCPRCRAIALIVQPRALVHELPRPASAELRRGLNQTTGGHADSSHRLGIFSEQVWPDSDKRHQRTWRGRRTTAMAPRVVTRPRPTTPVKRTDPGHEVEVYEGSFEAGVLYHRACPSIRRVAIATLRRETRRAMT